MLHLLQMCQKTNIFLRCISTKVSQKVVGLVKRLKVIYSVSIKGIEDMKERHYNIDEECVIVGDMN